MMRCVPSQSINLVALSKSNVLYFQKTLKLKVEKKVCPLHSDAETERNKMFSFVANV